MCVCILNTVPVTHMHIHMHSVDGLGGFNKPPEDVHVRERLIQRLDDSEEKVRTRLKEHHGMFA
jgi:hypothetical protein